MYRNAVSDADPGTTRMALDSPAQGAVLASSFQASGWALDPEAPSGTGVDAIELYAYRNFGSGESPMFLGNATYGDARADVSASYGDQFKPSGFSLNVTGVPSGSYRLFAFARNIAAGGYTAYVFADVTIAPFGAVAIDAPAAGAISTSAFVVAGWALDNQATSGTGIDAIHIYAAPNGGADPPVFLGVASIGWARPDVAAAYGPQFATSGYHFTITGMPPGDYALYVYAHSTVTNAFSFMQARAVRVDATTLISLDTPRAESALAGRGFAVAGWAFDRSATAGTGIDALHVYAYPDPGSGRAPVFLGIPSLGVARDDVAAAYGSQYARSGYTLSVDADALGLSPGIYDIVVWAHSSETNAFTASACVRVRLP